MRNGFSYQVIARHGWRTVCTLSDRRVRRTGPFCRIPPLRFLRGSGGGTFVTNVEIALEAAKRGSEVLLKYWQTLSKDDADLKSRHDWVSRADRESEDAIFRSLRERCPEDDFLGEESGAIENRLSTGRRTWIVDPLDGTSNYLQHFPFWCISIGLKEGDEVTAAVIYEPLRGTVFAAERGSGTWMDGERVRVSDHPGIEGSFLATGFPFRAQKYVSLYCGIFEDVIRVSKGIRRAGSAALDLAYTAAGVFDGFFELHLATWDVAAGSLLVREAGGVVTDFSGGDRYLQRGNIVGAPAGVHRDLMQVIRRHATEDDLGK